MRQGGRWQYNSTTDSGVYKSKRSGVLAECNWSVPALAPGARLAPIELQGG